MVNTNVQSPIPLAGRGYTQRDTKNYDNGEYPLLNNVFIEEDGLQSRYGIAPIGNTVYSLAFNNTKFFTDVVGFIGDFTYPSRNLPLMMGKNCFMGATLEQPGQFFTQTYWDPETLQAGQTNTNFRVPVKAFTYQDRNVVVVMKANEVAGNISSFDYHWANQGTGNGVPGTFNLICNRTVPPVGGAPEFDFVDAFAWKDRLWLVTRDTVYFSGIGTVANHQNFSAPVGGFIKYSGVIKSVEFLKDSLYVVCEKEVHIMTYSADPNTDAVNIMVSSSQGGDTSCIHNNTVYMTDGVSLYTINSNGVDKAMDLELFERYPTPGANNNNNGPMVPKQIQTKMLAYKNKIVLIYFDASCFGNAIQNTPFINRGVKLAFSSVADRSNAISEPFVDEYSEFSNSFMIDMDNGSITKLMFRDHRLNNFNGFVLDAMVSSDDRGTPRLYLLTSANRNSPGLVSPVPGSTYNFLYYYLDESSEFFTSRYNGNKSFDAFYSHAFGAPNVASVSITQRAVIPFNVYIKKFVPDGNEYLMKKFRSLLLMGNLPEYTMLQRIFGDNLPADPLYDAIGVTNTSSVMTNPRSYRFPLNQRGRWISLTIYRKSVAGAVDQIASASSAVNGDLLLIEDIRLFWTYTGKPQRTYGGSNPAVL